MTDKTPEGQDNAHLLLDHEYDGIQEYDNPMPRWWLATFWVTIIFAVLYVLNAPVFGRGPGQIAEYEADMQAAEAILAANDPLAGMTGELLMARVSDPAELEFGSATFASNCAACHAADGGGGIGPNLTDAWTLHGSEPMAVLRLINSGVAEKGMPPWGKVLQPEQLLAVAAYVISLDGKTSAAPKAPQGVHRDSTPGGTTAP